MPPRLVLPDQRNEKINDSLGLESGGLTCVSTAAAAARPAPGQQLLDTPRPERRRRAPLGTRTGLPRHVSASHCRAASLPEPPAESIRHGSGVPGSAGKFCLTQPDSAHRGQRRPRQRGLHWTGLSRLHMAGPPTPAGWWAFMEEAREPRMKPAGLPGALGLQLARGLYALGWPKSLVRFSVRWL